LEAGFREIVENDRRLVGRSKRNAPSSAWDQRMQKAVESLAFFVFFGTTRSTKSTNKASKISTLYQ